MVAVSLKKKKTSICAHATKKITKKFPNGNHFNDLNDYKAMNEVFRGRFGDEPPVRTTIAAAGGIPGNSLVEIDVIAYI